MGLFDIFSNEETWYVIVNKNGKYMIITEEQLNSADHGYDGYDDHGNFWWTYTGEAFNNKKDAKLAIKELECETSLRLYYVDGFNKPYSPDFSKCTCGMCAEKYKQSRRIED
jgi:hypothetical protein